MRKIIKFEKDGCAPCAALGNWLKENEIEHEAKNVMGDFDLINKYKLSSLPTLVVFEDDLEIARTSGFNIDKVKEVVYG